MGVSQDVGLSAVFPTCKRKIRERFIERLRNGDPTLSRTRLTFYDKNGKLVGGLVHGVTNGEIRIGGIRGDIYPIDEVINGLNPRGR